MDVDFDREGTGVKPARVIRFPTYASLVDARPRTLRERITADIRHIRECIRSLFRPRKAAVLKIKNPTQWKLERIRRKARGAL